MLSRIINRLLLLILILDVLGIHQELQSMKKSPSSIDVHPLIIIIDKTDDEVMTSSLANALSFECAPIICFSENVVNNLEKKIRTFFDKDANGQYVTPKNQYKVLFDSYKAYTTLMNQVDPGVGNFFTQEHDGISTIDINKFNTECNSNISIEVRNNCKKIHDSYTNKNSATQFLNTSSISLRDLTIALAALTYQQNYFIVEFINNSIKGYLFIPKKYAVQKGIDINKKTLTNDDLKKLLFNITLDTDGAQFVTEINPPKTVYVPSQLELHTAHLAKLLASTPENVARHIYIIGHGSPANIEGYFSLTLGTTLEDATELVNNLADKGTTFLYMVSCFLGGATLEEMTTTLDKQKQALRVELFTDFNASNMPTPQKLKDLALQQNNLNIAQILDRVSPNDFFKKTLQKINEDLTKLETEALKAKPDAHFKQLQTMITKNQKAFGDPLKNVFKKEIQQLNTVINQRKKALNQILLSKTAHLNEKKLQARRNMFIATATTSEGSVTVSSVTGEFYITKHARINKLYHESLYADPYSMRLDLFFTNLAIWEQEKQSKTYGKQEKKIFSNALKYLTSRTSDNNISPSNIPQLLIPGVSFSVQGVDIDNKIAFLGNAYIRKLELEKKGIVLDQQKVVIIYPFTITPPITITSAEAPVFALQETGATSHYFSHIDIGSISLQKFITQSFSSLEEYHPKTILIKELQTSAGLYSNVIIKPATDQSYDEKPDRRSTSGFYTLKNNYYSFTLDLQTSLFSTQKIRNFCWYRNTTNNSG